MKTLECDKQAQRKAQYAVKSGQIVKKLTCEECGQTKTRKDGFADIAGHHDDYSKPLDVRWLCTACHIRWHAHNKAKGRVPKTHKAIKVDLDLLDDIDELREDLLGYFAPYCSHVGKTRLARLLIKRGLEAVLHDLNRGLDCHTRDIGHPRDIALQLPLMRVLEPETT